MCALYVGPGGFCFGQNLRGERHGFAELERRCKSADLWVGRFCLEKERWKECQGGEEPPGEVPPGRDAKIRCFEDQCGRIFLSTSEDADLNGWLLSCDLNQRGATDSTLFSGLLGDHAGMCKRWLCPSPEGSRREAPFLFPRHCNPDVA